MVIVNPSYDLDKVRYKTWNFALDQNVIAFYDIFVLCFGRILLAND